MFEKTSFGSVTYLGETYDYDILVLPNGSVKRRQKEISKSKHGTSHFLDPAEFKLLGKADVIVVGTGQSGALSLSPEAEEWARGNQTDLVLLPTPEAIRHFNQRTEKKAALIHITC